MELVARKADLVRELQFFQQIVERKNTIPILANVLLEGTGNEVTLLATDLEVALRSRCEAAVNKPGAVTLPAKKLYEVVRALPDGDVNIETDKGGTTVRGIGWPVQLEDADPAEGRFSQPAGSWWRRQGDHQRQVARANGGEDAICDHRRRHALLLERRAIRVEAGRHDVRRHRRPSARPRQRQARGPERRRHQGDSAAQDPRRTWTPARRRQQRRQLRARRESLVLRDRSRGC